MSRILLVAPYPPRACGIGRYAAAQAQRLRREGHDVAVLSPPDGDGDMRVEFLGGGAFRTAARARGFDRVVVHFQPALYFRPRAPLSKVAAAAALWWLCRRRPEAEILVHEADPPVRWRPDYLLLRAAFRAAPALLFHTDRERRQLERAYRIRARARLVSHTDGVQVRAAVPRREARKRLGIPEDETLFVAAGFLHPDKGFDRAIESFRAVGRGRLAILGSVRERSPRNQAHAARLRELAASTRGVDLVERYLTDEEFDAWIAAADAVVLPYRRSWSSGVLARAQALGTPAVVTDVGGLPEQASGRDVVVRDDDELAAAMARLAAGRDARVRP
ncbi:MAG TPA: glycosyltransferase family 4 protein [Actinomycetota bacterium]|nr:glycosyltransferase family 4 protein [Actinomycetota bacterium]